tara:strand:- start:2200 stop:2433 length:234 start_codon:yes stop_codon:yes gene_type:complete
MPNEYEQYCLLLSQIENSLDGVIYELEDYTSNPKQRASTAAFNDLKFDAIPLLRKLKEARKYAQESNQHFSPNSINR